MIIVEHVLHIHVQWSATNLLVKSMPLFKDKSHVDTPRQVDECRVDEYHQEKHNCLLHLNQYSICDTMN